MSIEGDPGPLDPSRLACRGLLSLRGRARMLKTVRPIKKHRNHTEEKSGRSIKGGKGGRRDAVEEGKERFTVPILMG